MKYFILTITTLLFSYSHAFAQYPDRHSTDPDHGWRSCETSVNPNPNNDPGHWIMFNFQEVFNLSQVLMWNTNEPEHIDMGIQDFKVDYSLDGTNWTSLGTFELEQSTGSTFYEGVEAFNFGNISTQYVLISALNNYGGSCTGFDEIRFMTGNFLPLELLSFEVICDDEKAVLNWEATELVNVENIAVERSIDAKEWKTLSSNVPESTVINGVHGYEFTDHFLYDKKTFYRLKITDFDGNHEYSEIRTSNCYNRENIVEVYPNPVKDLMQVNIEMEAAEEVEYYLFDVLGRDILRGNFQAAAGSSQKSIDVSDLKVGSYILKIEFNNQSRELKIIKAD